MSRAFVIDASVAIAWIHPAQATEQTRAMLEAVADGAVIEVPALWPIEVANALLVLERRRKLNAAERGRALEWLPRLPLKVDHEMALLAFGPVSELAAEFSLSVYDAVYLELAMRRRLPLACKDGALLDGARRARAAIWRAPESR